MPNFLETTGHPVFPTELDSLDTFIQMTGSPLAITTLAEGLDTIENTIQISDCGVLDPGPSVVTIVETGEIIYYQSLSVEHGLGDMQNCIRNWGNNVRRFDVTAASSASSYFEIDGDHRSKFPDGFRFTLYGSTGNDGEYTVNGAPTLESGDTRIVVDEAVTSDVADGVIYQGSAGIGSAASIGSHVCHLLGAEQIRIMSEAMVAVQQRIGKSLSTDPASHEYRINQLEGAAAGSVYSYGIMGAPVATTVADGDVVTWDGSEFVETDISTGDRPHGTAREVTSVYPVTASDEAAETFTIAGEHTAEFPPGATFTVSGSVGDNGTYTVVSSTIVGGDTVITVADVPAGGDDGDITVSAWKVTFGGRDGGHSGLTPGSAYYADPSSAGGISTTQSEWFIGVAYTSTDLILSIQRGEPWPRVLRSQSVGGSVVENDIVYYNASASRYDQADANGVGTHPPVGFAKNVSGGVADIIIEGPASGMTGLVPGAVYYLSNTLGQETLAPLEGTTSQGWIVGHAMNTSTMWVDIQRNPHASQVPVENLFSQIAATDYVQDALENIDAWLDSLTHAQVSSTDPTTDVTGAELEQLTDESETVLHRHKYLQLDIFSNSDGDGDGFKTFQVPSGYEARIDSFGGDHRVSWIGTFSWDAGADATLITLSGGDTTGMVPGALISLFSILPPAYHGDYIIDTVVSSTQIRVTRSLTGSASNVACNYVAPNSESDNFINWTIKRITDAGVTTLVSGGQSAWNDTYALLDEEDWLMIGVNGAGSPGVDWSLRAWVRIELRPVT